MKRIDTANVHANLFGPGKSGFQPGSPSTNTPATFLSADWCNHLQEEISNVIEHFGIALDAGSRNQLLTALLANFASAAVNPVESVTTGVIGGSPTEVSSSGYIQFNTGHLIQFGAGYVPAANGTSGVTLSFPTAFSERCYQIVATDYQYGIPVIGVSQFSATQFRAWAKDGSTGAYQNSWFRWIAIGK
jgi:hypothetical protein